MNNSRLAGHALVEQLVELGADRVFSVPGESFLAIIDGLREHQDRIGLTIARHEGGAAMMAVAHAKVTGRPGVCMVTRGPGAANASIGVHIARQDGVPLVVVVGQIPVGQRDRGALQEVRHDRVFGELAKAAYEVSTADRLPEYVNRAWHEALSGRPGPVVLSVPEDVSAAYTEVPIPEPVPAAQAGASSQLCTRVARRLRSAQRPLIVVGGYTWSHEARGRIVEIASRLSVPVCNSVRQQDLIPNSADVYIGSLGLDTSPHLAKAVSDADVILVIGTQLDAFSTDDYETFAPAVSDSRLIHVMPDPDELNVVFPAGEAVVASTHEFVLGLHTAAESQPSAHASPWLESLRSQQLQRWRSQRETLGGSYMSVLEQHIPADAFMCAGAGSYTAWYQNSWTFDGHPRQLATQSGSMGFGLPAAIGATLAAPGSSACAWGGDGCFLMTSQELATAAREELDILVIVVNNSRYGTIAQHQWRQYPGADYGTDLTNPDFGRLARSYGLPGEAVSSTEEFSAVLEQWKGMRGPRLIEIRLLD